MTTLREGDLELHVPDTAVARKFDGPSHGLSHCMKAIDFIVHHEDAVYFIEFKDPEHPSAPEEERARFLNKFLSGELLHDLTRKFRDTFLYEWASDNLDGRPVYYLILVGLSNLDEALLLHQSDALRRRLPVDGPKSGVWKRPLARDALIFNIKHWNRHVPFSVTRVTETPARE